MPETPNEGPAPSLPRGSLHQVLPTQTKPRVPHSFAFFAKGWETGPPTQRFWGKSRPQPGRHESYPPSRHPEAAESPAKPETPRRRISAPGSFPPKPNRGVPHLCVLCKGGTRHCQSDFQRAEKTPSSPDSKTNSVIPTEAKRSGGTLCSAGPLADQRATNSMVFGKGPASAGPTRIPMNPGFSP